MTQYARLRNAKVVELLVEMALGECACLMKNIKPVKLPLHYHSCVSLHVNEAEKPNYLAFVLTRRSCERKMLLAVLSMRQGARQPRVNLSASLRHIVHVLRPFVTTISQSIRCKAKPPLCGSALQAHVSERPYSPTSALKSKPCTIPHIAVSNQLTCQGRATSSDPVTVLLAARQEGGACKGSAEGVRGLAGLQKRG